MLQEIRIEDIYVSETASQTARRKHFELDELDELKASIKEFGVLQPIVVRPRPTDGGYTHELVAGERRFLASDALELETIPAVVRELTDGQVIEVQLIENLQRKDLHPMQEAEGYQELMQKHGHPVEELHDRVGKSRSYVYGRLKLLALSKKARDAFYGNKISASIALLIARIPGHKLQEQAIRDMTDYNGIVVSFRRAKEIVHGNYMLRLKGAPFPTGDAELHKQAGPCTTCPKRTGSQPELFGDVESADVCTDPVCFGVKRKEHGDRLIKEAQKSWQPVITGKAAKDLTYPYNDELKGYTRLDAKSYSDGKSRSVRSVVGKDAEVTLVQLPKTGEVVEVVKDAAVQAAVRKKAPARVDDPYRRQQREEQRKLKIERAYRKALYDEVRPHLPPPGLRLIARKILERMEHDLKKALADVVGLDVKPTKRQWGSPYRDHGGALDKHLEQLPEADLPLFLNDAIYVGELQVSGYNLRRKPKALEEAAGKVPGISTKAIRRQVTAKKKAKKKTKKKGSKPASGGLTAARKKKKAAKKSGKKAAPNKKAKSRKKAAA